MSYIPVSSNDTLSHLALPSSPETLCGQLVVGTPPTPYSRALEPGGPKDTPADAQHDYLPCDICSTLSGGDSILKQTHQIEAGRACPHCQDGFDDTGHACWNCGGTGWLDEGDSDDYGFNSYLQGIDTEYPRGTKVASKDDRTEEVNRLRQSSVGKIATNWTRDGEAIENGFDLVISKEQAARTPFLDLTRVSVSEQRECPDCNETHWLAKIASCMDCDGLKCNNCMETISLGGFLGTCKKCAGADSDEIYEADYEDAQDDQSTYLSYLMAEDEAETDALFLPNEE